MAGRRRLGNTYLLSLERMSSSSKKLVKKDKRSLSFTQSAVELQDSLLQEVWMVKALVLVLISFASLGFAAFIF